MPQRVVVWLNKFDQGLGLTERVQTLPNGYTTMSIQSINKLLSKQKISLVILEKLIKD